MIRRERNALVIRARAGGSQIGATILHPNTKVLVNQGLFVFLGVKNTPPFTIAPFLEPFGLEPAALREDIENFMVM